MARHTDIRMREFLRVYYGTVRLIDDQVGRVLDALDESGRADDTIVIFTADHGDMVSGHGMVWKSTSAFYDEIARIPMIISWPRRIRAGKSEAAASLADLAPTTLDLIGHSIPAACRDQASRRCCWDNRARRAMCTAFRNGSSQTRDTRGLSMKEQRRTSWCAAAGGSTRCIRTERISSTISPKIRVKRGTSPVNGTAVANGRICATNFAHGLTGQVTRGGI